MDFPMMQQPGTQQPAQGQPQQGPQGGSFPSSQGEAMQFSNDILETLLNEDVRANITKQVQQIPEQVPIGQGIGMISAQLVGGRFADVKAQTGRPIEMRVALDALKAVVGEVSEIAEETGRKVAPEDKGEAMKAGVGILNQAGGQQNGPQPMG